MLQRRLAILVVEKFRSRHLRHDFANDPDSFCSTFAEDYSRPAFKKFRSVAPLERDQRAVARTENLLIPTRDFTYARRLSHRDAVKHGRVPDLQRRRVDQYQNLRGETPRRSRIPIRIHEHHTFPDVLLCDVTLLRLDRERRGLTSMDVIDGHALVLNALHRDRHERAVAVGTEQHLLLVRDATAKDDAADDSADALHRERIVQVHHPVTFLADVEDASCRDVVQEQPDEVHALASDARRVEHRRDRSLRDRLAAAQGLARS